MQRINLRTNVLRKRKEDFQHKLTGDFVNKTASLDLRCFADEEKGRKANSGSRNWNRVFLIECMCEHTSFVCVDECTLYFYLSEDQSETERRQFRLSLLSQILEFTLMLG